MSRLRAAALRNFLSVVDSIRKGSDTSGRVLARLGSHTGSCLWVFWAGWGSEPPARSVGRLGPGNTWGRRGHPVPAAYEAARETVLSSLKVGVSKLRSFPKLRTGHAEDEGPLDRSFGLPSLDRLKPTLRVRPRNLPLSSLVSPR